MVSRSKYASQSMCPTSDHERELTNSSATYLDLHRASSKPPKVRSSCWSAWSCKRLKALRNRIGQLEKGVHWRVQLHDCCHWYKPRKSRTSVRFNRDEEEEETRLAPHVCATRSATCIWSCAWRVPKSNSQHQTWTYGWYPWYHMRRWDAHWLWPRFPTPSRQLADILDDDQGAETSCSLRWVRQTQNAAPHIVHPHSGDVYVSRGLL